MDGTMATRAADTALYRRVFEGKDLRAYTPHEVGVEGESLARHYLEGKGFDIVERNWRCPYGEADIIATIDAMTVMVEVKTRLDLHMSGTMEPEVAVDAQKQGRYGRIARAYLVEHPDALPVRFDVLALSLRPDGHASVHYVPGAFCVEG